MEKPKISDYHQREQALDPTKSFIVQAPAGSGKTELLTQRFLRLLSCVHEPEEILGITFTKKAASEMRGRISAALKKAQEEPLPQTLHEQKTWQLAKAALKQDQKRQWDLLANPNRLRIKTIDAFNSLLTQQLPLLSHFGAQPEIMDQPQLLYREAVQTFLTHLEENLAWSKAIARLLSHVNNNMQKMEDLLIKMLATRDQWLPHIIAHQNHPSLRHNLECNLKSVIQAALTKLKDHFPKDAAPELLALAQFAISNLKASNLTSPLLHCESLKALPDTSPENLAAYRGLVHLLMTDKYQWRKKVDTRLGFPPAAKPFKQRLEKLIEHLRQDEKLTMAFTELQHLPNAAYTEQQWAILEALHEVLKIVVAQLQVTFKVHGKIDYTENALAALLSLGSADDPTDLALVMDYQIKHILVDEFQDTSNNQFRLLEKLVNGWQQGDQRSLFLVGDPMQSIYRFREAEVGLFLRARHQGIGPVSLIPLTLSVNFRSNASIVHWINGHFDKILPAYDDLTNGAISYSPSTAHDQHSKKAEAVQIHAFVNDFPQTQASTLVQIIQETLERRPADKIAILVRSRSHLASIIPSLKEAKINFQAVEIDPLETKPLIQDLLALTRALLYPADRIAWLSILRAPWCGLLLDDLLLLTQNQKQKIIWENLQNKKLLSTLSADGQKRIARVLPILQIAINERHRQELHLWIEKTWILLGGPACLENELALKDTKTFFDLLKRISLNSNSFNSGALWHVLQESIQKLYAQSDNAAQIQIMTIHNAKGLEFDAVILPQLQKSTKPDDKPLLIWQERPLINHDAALLLAPIHAADEDADHTYNYIRQQENIKTRHENGRLLYVAATRAKKSLHLLLSLKKNNKDELLSPAESSMLKNLWPAIHHELHYSLARETGMLKNQSQPSGLKRLSSHWKNPEAYKIIERPLHNKIQGFHLAENNAQALGIVVHRIFQELAKRGIGWWQERSAEQQKHYLHHLLLQNKVLPASLEETGKKAKQAIENCLADPRGRWILEQKQGQAELALTAMLEQQATMLIIDRTFVDKDDIRWIIDYKTASPQKEEALQYFLLREKEKYAEKMSSYGLAMQALETRAIRYGLYFPLLPAWYAWDSN